MSARRRGFLILGASLGVMVLLSWAYTALPQGEASRRQLWGLGQANYHEFREKLNASRLPSESGLLALGLTEEEPAPVVASPAGGAFEGPVTVELRANGRIHYTLDGSIPTRRSPTYREPLRIDSSTVLRARVLTRGSQPPPAAAWHFVLRGVTHVPVVSIATDPVGLWNKYSGIYANPQDRGRAWEREAHVGYIAVNGSAVQEIPAEIRIHGGYSRMAAKKSFRIRFDDATVATLPDHVLRSGAASGTNRVVVRGDGGNPVARIRDALAGDLYRTLGGAVSRGEPVEVLLNGDYWGLYDLREHVGEGFLLSRFGPGSYEHLTHDSENVEDWLTPVVGTRDGWDATLRQLGSLELETPDGLAAAADLIDIDNTLDYWLHNVYIANVDWPYNNVHIYRRIDGSDRRWRWIAWDMDPAFLHIDHNTLAWALRDRVRNDLKWNYLRGAFEDSERFLISTWPLRMLLRNPAIRDRFIARAQVLLQLHYTEDDILPRLDSLLDRDAAARRRDAARWGWSDSTFHAAIDTIRSFVRERPRHVQHHLADAFGLGEPVTVRFDVAGPGTLSIDGHPLPDGGVTLQLLRGTRIRLSAAPDSTAVLAPGLAAESVVHIDEPTRLEYRFVRK